MCYNASLISGLILWSLGLGRTTFFGIYSKSENVMQALYTKDPHRLNRETLGRCSPDILQFRRHRYLYHLCRRQPEVAVTAVNGLKEAVSECQKQMKYHRWDCTQNHPTQRIKYTLLHDPPIIAYGYPESGFLLAMSSAGVAWSVARSCAEGRLTWCSCNVHQQAKQQSWEWAGCSYSVKFGLITSRRLLTKKRQQRHVHSATLKQAHRHNLKAGRLAVKKTLAKACKCHGVSGSCQLKTCWKATADLSRIGDHLKRKLHKAHFLLSNVSPNDSRASAPPIKAKSAELVYYEKGPSYCRPLSYLRTTGTTGRVCNVYNGTHSSGDCRHLCCGRGHTSTNQTYEENCNCEFHWCCYVTCSKCTKWRQVSVCN